MENYVADVSKYTEDVNEAAVNGIVKYLGIALKSRDASLVACTDPVERDRIREGFLKKKLALEDSDADLDAAIQEICDEMKADRTKSRVTFYYLLAEEYGKLSLFVK